MQELQGHYYGTSKVTRKKKVARYDFKKIFYKNGNTFIFEKYVIKLKEVFSVLDKYGVPVYEEQVVAHMIDQIMLPNI